MSWFERILGSNKRSSEMAAPSPSTGFFDMDGQPVPLSISQLDIRQARELVRTSAANAAEAFGIPSNWLSYEVVTISDDEKAYFQLQVSLRIWDEQLWAQASAFEQQALKFIREENANVARAVRAVLWRILPDAGCPYDELSGPEAWLPPAVKARSVAYEKMRAQIALPAAPSLTAEATDSAATLPLARSLESMFKDTHPGSATGFDATRPFMPDDGARKN